MNRSYMIVVTKRPEVAKKQDATTPIYGMMRSCELQLRYRREEIQRKYSEMLEPIQVISDLHQIPNFKVFYKVKIVPILENNAARIY